MDRRSFLRLVGLVGAGAALGGCQPLYGQLVMSPHSSGVWSAVDPDAFRMLQRLSFGPTGQALRDVAELGISGWVEDQLDPEGIEDMATTLRLRPIDELRMNASLLADLGDRLFDGYDGSGVVSALRKGTLLRQTYSRRQLYEHMVAFWTDHFNVSTTKGDCWFLKVVDDREVIRPNALGSFRDLLLKSIQSPAMLVYLDNHANHRNAPNENLAREVLELHTLGVDGGYGQSDVESLAQVLTGWTTHNRFRRGAVRFDEGAHDDGTKVVLGGPVTSAGEHELETIVDRLATHPSTARHIATKLVRRFVCDDPCNDAQDLVERAATAFTRTGGDILAMLRVVLLDGLTLETTPPGPKLKRPNELVVSALRGLGANTDGGDALHDHVAQMGQPLFAWPTPDGPPDKADTWRSAMLPRWQFAIALSGNEIEGTSIDLRRVIRARTADPPEAAIDTLSTRLLGAPLATETRSAIMRELRFEDSHDADEVLAFVAAAILSSGAFQWR